MNMFTKGHISLSSSQVKTCCWHWRKSQWITKINQVHGARGRSSFRQVSPLCSHLGKRALNEKNHLWNLLKQLLKNWFNLPPDQVLNTYHLAGHISTVHAHSLPAPASLWLDLKCCDMMPMSSSYQLCLSLMSFLKNVFVCVPRKQILFKMLMNLSCTLTSVQQHVWLMFPRFSCFKADALVFAGQWWDDCLWLMVMMPFSSYNVFDCASVLEVDVEISPG